MHYIKKKIFRKIMNFETDRLKLSLVKMSDIKDLLKNSTQEMIDKINLYPFRSLCFLNSDIKNFVKQNNKDYKKYFYIIRDKKSEKFLGFVSFYQRNEKKLNTVLRVKYYILLQERKNGYLSEAYIKLSNELRKYYFLRKIRADMHIDNLDSINFVLKHGFNKESEIFIEYTYDNYVKRYLSFSKFL
jgi:RimJ/RimL family protein N-acetyltransferase